LALRESAAVPTDLHPRLGSAAISVLHKSFWRGTEGSNPSPSSSESRANLKTTLTFRSRLARIVAERLVASAVMVNDHTTFRTDWMPFAGRRQTGYGVGGIPWTMREMTEQKMIVFKT
jgi:hypothetical protein